MIETERKWILVAGSGVDGIPEKIVATSKALGRALADAGFCLVSGGWPGVDHIVSRAFAEAVKETQASLTVRLMQFMKKGSTPDFPSGRFLAEGSEDEAWDASIAISDAIVLIGGLGGAYGTGQAGRRLGKPVLPLADTRGEGGSHSDAYQFYFDMLQSWTSKPISGLTLDDFHCLGDPAPEVTTDLVRLLTKLFGQQPYSAPARQNYRLPNKEAALQLWNELLEFLRKEEPVTVEPILKFQLKKKIEQAQAKIFELRREV